MVIIKKARRSTVVILIIILSVFFLTRCNTNNNKPIVNNDHFNEYAGSAKCAGCHKDIYTTHVHTEHFLSSQAAAENNILGSFEPGKNQFAFDASTKVLMEKRDSGLYQVAYILGQEKKAGRFDITVGSGRKGQSYLSWIRNSLVQMPITYFTPESTWSNSPGFNPRKVVFNRVITSRCLECHTTYFLKTSDTTKRPEEFDHQKIIYGIDCERCHGPAAMHVDFQTKNPMVKEAKYIVNTGKLSRERNLDLCALCHGGQLSKTKPSFSFQPGDTLANYFSLNSAPPNADNIDLHGNQFGLLSLSKCFTSSDMTCISCHNVHENEKDKIEVFSQRCMNCHSEGHEKQCKLTSSIGPAIKQNCIDCHMPKFPSHAVAVFLEGADVPTPALLRTHYIKIYSAETEKVLKMIRGAKTPGKTGIK